MEGEGESMDRTLFVVDAPGWSYDFTYEELKPYLNIDRMYVQDYKHRPEYKYVHFMNWLDGKEYSGVSGGLTSHNFEIKHYKQAKKKIPKMRAIVAISKNLEKKGKILNPNTYYCPNGVNESKFIPCKSRGEFTVGWVGQPTSGGFGEKKSSEGVKIFDIKGYELILKPLMAKMDVNFKVLDNPSQKPIPHDDMMRWYADIDCFLCTSMYEGGPLTVLEAAACGKSIISTRVGIVPELIAHGYNGYLVEPYRKKEDIPRTLEAMEMYIHKARETNGLMGLRARREIEKAWTWKKVAKNWEKVFP